MKRTLCAHVGLCPLPLLAPRNSTCLFTPTCRLVPPPICVCVAAAHGSMRVAMDVDRGDLVSAADALDFLLSHAPQLGGAGAASHSGAWGRGALSAVKCAAAWARLGHMLWEETSLLCGRCRCLSPTPRPVHVRSRWRCAVHDGLPPSVVPVSFPGVGGRAAAGQQRRRPYAGVRARFGGICDVQALGCLRPRAGPAVGAAAGAGTGQRRW